jgi:murein DD-endopeptidase MepM/ murein hydrolase activator NlpD
MTIRLEWPIYREARITQLWGVNPGTYTVGCRPDGSHNGLDWGCAIGTPIYATADGQVTVAQEDKSGYGLHVRIQHDGFLSIYAHLSQLRVQPGDRVTAGQTIGLSGNTGNSTGPHLHFEIRLIPDRCTSTVDPLFYLNSQAASLVHGVVTPAGNGLRVREAPNTSAKIKRGLLAGTPVTLIEITPSNWGRLYEAGQSWICLGLNGVEYVKLSEPAPPPEVSDAEKLRRLWNAHPELHY